MREFFITNTSLKLLSFLFALIVWYYVIIAVNPTVFRVYRVNLDVYDSQENLQYSGIPEKVEVEVSGRRLDLIQLFRNPPYPVQAYVSLEGVTSERVLSIRTKKLVNVEDFSIVGPKSSGIRVGVTRLDERRFMVTHTLLGSPERGYRIEKVKIEPDRVRVLGISQIMERVKSAQVTLDIAGVTSERSLSLPVQFFDDHGESIEGLRLIPEGPVRVVIEVRKLPEKTVPLKAVIIGREPEGFEFVEARVQPSSVIVRGPAAALEKLESLNLEPVDVTGITNEKNFRARVDLPAGNLTLLGEPKAQVAVRVRARTGSRNFPGVKVQLTNVPPGMEAQSIPPEFDLKITGWEMELSRLAPEDLTARVDLRRVVPNTEVEPEIILPRELTSLKFEGKIKVRIGLKPRVLETEEPKKPENSQN